MARREVPTRPVARRPDRRRQRRRGPDPAGRRLRVARRSAAATGLLAAFAAPIAASFFASSPYLSTGPVAITSLLVLGGLSGLAAEGSAAVRRPRRAAGALRGCRAPRPRALRRRRPRLPDVPTGPGRVHRSGRAADPAVAGAGCRRGASRQRPARTSGVRRPDRPEPVGAERGRLLGGHHRRDAPRATAARDLPDRPDPGGRRGRRRLDHRCRRAGRRCGEHRWCPQPARPAVVATRCSSSLPALVIALVGFAEPAAISRKLAAEDRQHWSSDRELVSQGVANLASGMAGGYPVGGSFSRSTLNRLAGARTRWSGLVAGLLVLVFLPFAEVLESLPKLGAGRHRDRLGAAPGRPPPGAQVLEARQGAVRHRRHHLRRLPGRWLRVSTSRWSSASGWRPSSTSGASCTSRCRPTTRTVSCTCVRRASSTSRPLRAWRTRSTTCSPSTRAPSGCGSTSTASGGSTSPGRWR